MARSKKFLTKEEIQEIDKRVPLIPVYFDPIFKGVFLSDLEILKDYIITVLKLDIRPEDCTIKLLNGELLKRNYKEYQKTVDVIVSLTDDLYVTIEVNNKDYTTVKFRNDAYNDKVYSTIVEAGEKMEKFKEKTLYQLNLNVKGFNDGDKDGVIVPYDLVKNEIHSDNKVIVLKYLEVYQKEFYNGSREKDVCLLASLLAKNFTDFYERLEGAVTDEVRDKLVRRLIEMCEDELNVELWDIETTNKFIEMNEIEEAKEKAKAETKIDTVKKLLKLNTITIEEISTVTGLSTKEIEEIKNQENL